MKNIKLSIKNLNQRYDGKRILNNISLDIFAGETVVILGSSGCGKTSLLKSVAGLIPIESGTMLLDGRAIESLPPQQRNAIMIFQNYALFPHMSVRKNLEYGLKIKKTGKDRIRKKTAEIIGMLRLEGLEDRPVANLSGGQQQRVAIGRALIVEPSVLLFDEPLSNLDENLRKNMRREIKRILREARCTSLYVTHDQNEAIAMADRVVVMKDGNIEQIAAPDVLYYKPANEHVAGFLGFRNIFSADSLSSYTPLKKPDSLVLIRPEEIRIINGEDSKRVQGENEIFIPGTVNETELLVSTRSYTVSTELGEVNVLVMNRASLPLLSAGDQVQLVINPDSFHYLNGRKTK